MKKENDLRRIFDDEDWEEIKKLAVNLIEEKFRRLNEKDLVNTTTDADADADEEILVGLKCLRSDDKSECLLIFDSTKLPISVSLKFDE